MKEITRMNRDKGVVIHIGAKVSAMMESGRIAKELVKALIISSVATATRESS